MDFSRNVLSSGGHCFVFCFVSNVDDGYDTTEDDGDKGAILMMMIF